MKWKKEIIGNMTIKEIAQLAQVSSAAVSRYLNGGYISEEKKERIRAAIEKTGYHPSAQARNLRTKRARLIGVVAPRLSSESVARVTDGIGEVLAEKQFQMLLTVRNNQSDKELETMRLFENYPVDGIILIATVISRKHEVFFEQSRVPIVVIGQYTDKANCVYHDDYGAAKALAEKISSSGQKKIAYIGVTRDDRVAGQAREDGFRDGLREQGIKLMKERYRLAECSVESGYHQAKDLLDKEPDIDILSCATDTIAAGVMQALKERKPDKRKKFQVTGFGDNRFLRAVSDGITTVHFYDKTSGVKAAEMLLDAIEHGNQVPMQMKLGYRIVEY